MGSAESAKLLELIEKRKLIESEEYQSNIKRQKEDLLSRIENLVQRADNAEKAFLETHEKLGESRLTKDFVVGVELGSGAYGSVWKCTHRLDKRAYAIKRVRYVGSHEVLLSEVYAMSKLHHEGIIRYFTCWIEVDEITPEMDVKIIDFRKKEDTSTDDDEDDSDDDVENEDSDSDGDEDVKVDDLQKENSDKQDDEDYVEKDTDADVEKNDSDKQDDEDDTDLETENSDNDDESEKTNSDTDDVTENSNVINYSDLREDGDVESLHCSLFIQMELCERTLYAAIIESPKPLDDQTGRRYFKEIVEAISYMHQQGIIHRDLSSMNIFLDESSKIKIGDFGIAHVGSPDLHAASAGNEFYREPKRRLGVKIDDKTDIYSLGILFFELVSGVSTHMERLHLFKDLRKKLLPDNLKPKDKSFITLLTSKNASSRPSAEDILQQLRPWEY